VQKRSNEKARKSCPSVSIGAYYLRIICRYRFITVQKSPHPNR
jgi:hypothetical protein